MRNNQNRFATWFHMMFPMFHSHIWSPTKSGKGKWCMKCYRIKWKFNEGGNDE